MALSSSETMVEAKLKAKFSEWLNDRFDEILAAPEMWGNHEAVALQLLLLLETLDFVRDPETDPKRVLVEFQDPHSSLPLWEKCGNVKQVAQLFEATRKRILPHAAPAPGTAGSD